MVTVRYSFQRNNEAPVTGKFEYDGAHHTMPLLHGWPGFHWGASPFDRSPDHSRMFDPIADFRSLFANPFSCSWFNSPFWPAPFWGRSPFSGIVPPAFANAETSVEPSKPPTSAAQKPEVTKEATVAITPAAAKAEKETYQLSLSPDELLKIVRSHFGIPTSATVNVNVGHAEQNTHTTASISPAPRTNAAPATSTAKPSKPQPSSCKEAYLIQPLPVEGKGGLVAGGYTHTMTARELLDIVRACHGIPQDKPFKVIGVGATEALGDEITYLGDTLYKISGKEGKIATTKLDLNTKVSFSQVGLQAVDGLSYRKHFDVVKAPNSDKDAHEINHGGAFGELLKAIGAESSAMVDITAHVGYIKTRAVCPMVAGTDHKQSPAAPLGVMIKGGEVPGSNPKQTVTPQTVWEQTFKTPERLQMAGVITGTNMAENVALKGLHVHCKHGHVLDLGELRDVDVTITPIARTFILLPEKGKDGKPVWHSALQEQHVESVTNLQRLWRARKHRGDSEQANTHYEALAAGVREGKCDVRSWVDHVVEGGGRVGEREVKRWRERVEELESRRVEVIESP